jgi:hypothetical protein
VRTLLIAANVSADNQLQDFQKTLVMPNDAVWGSHGREPATAEIQISDKLSYPPTNMGNGFMGNQLVMSEAKLLAVWPDRMFVADLAVISCVPENSIG